MRYIPLSNASYQLHIHIIFNKINCAMFQKIVPKDFMCMKNSKIDTMVHIKSKQILIPNYNAIVYVDWII